MSPHCILNFLILTQGCIYWFEREKRRGRESKRNIHARNIPFMVWLGNKSATFWYTGRHSTMSHPARASRCILNKLQVSDHGPRNLKDLVPAESHSTLCVHTGLLFIAQRHKLYLTRILDTFSSLCLEISPTVLCRLAPSHPASF